MFLYSKHESHWMALQADDARFTIEELLDSGSRSLKSSFLGEEVQQHWENVDEFRIYRNEVTEDLTMSSSKLLWQIKFDNFLSHSIIETNEFKW